VNTADSFSATYQEARSKFRDAARDAGAGLDSVANPHRGPDGGDLSTDVVWIGQPDADRVLVMISGTHGVEGFCGSGAQVDWLRRGEAARLPPGVAVLMIHAANPHGFAWLRRVTEENVDLNRNWIDFDAPLPANPGYDALRDALCPAEWTESAQRASNRVLAAYAGAHGLDALVAASSGGQYVDPKGVFFGGSAPTWARRTQAAILTERLSGARSVGIIDYHTGLGPWGYGEQIITEGRNDPAYRRASGWFGAALASIADGASASTRISGDGLEAAPRILPWAEVTSIALEFGTIPGNRVLKALRGDNWLHAHGDPAAPEAAPIKAAIRAAFYGDRDDWKGMVAGQSVIACRQALAGLAAS